MKQFIKPFCLMLLISAIASVMLIFILSALLFFIGMSEGILSIGVTMIYLISTFLGGFCLGKKMKTKRFIWGILLGLFYFILLLLMGNIFFHGTPLLKSHAFPVLLYCILGGMLGGILGM